MTLAQSLGIFAAVSQFLRRAITVMEHVSTNAGLAELLARTGSGALQVSYDESEFNRPSFDDGSVEATCRSAAEEHGFAITACYISGTAPHLGWMGPGDRSVILTLGRRPGPRRAVTDPPPAVRDEEEPVVPCEGCGKDAPRFCDHCVTCGRWVCNSCGVHDSTDSGQVYMTCNRCLALIAETADWADDQFQRLLALMNAAGNPGMTANTLGQRRERNGLRQKEVWVSYPIPGWPVGPQEFKDPWIHKPSLHEAVLLPDGSVRFVDGLISGYEFSGRPGDLLHTLQDIARAHQVA